MGNCIDLLFSQPQEKIRVVIFNGGEEEFMPSTTVEQITSGQYHGYRLVHQSHPYKPLPPDGKLVSGEIYYLLPDVGSPFSPPISPRIAGKDGPCGRIKVVVTKQQFKEMILKSGTKEFPVEEFAVRVLEVGGECRDWKWRPSLATIPELCVS